ncbi:hypothetical protein Tco_0581353 [Tanacetum coccineum]
MKDPCESFNELMDTPLDFSAFVMSRLKVDTLTPKLLVGPTFEQMKGSCKSLVELEYFFEEAYKTTTDQLDWNNPEGQQYPHDLRKPLPLIPNSRGLQVIPFDHFINNDLVYLSGGVSSRKYTTSTFSMTKTRLRLQIYSAQSKGKDKKNRLMRIDELHKFSDGTLNDVRTDLDDHVKGNAENDCDEIPKRPTMYLNLWSYKAVRHRYSNPMIQPEPEGSTQGYPLDSVEVLRHELNIDDEFYENELYSPNGHKTIFRSGTSRLMLVFITDQRGTDVVITTVLDESDKGHTRHNVDYRRPKPEGIPTIGELNSRRVMDS